MGVWPLGGASAAAAGPLQPGGPVPPAIGYGGRPPSPASGAIVVFDGASQIVPHDPSPPQDVAGSSPFDEHTADQLLEGMLRMREYLLREEERVRVADHERTEVAIVADAVVAQGHTAIADVQEQNRQLLQAHGAEAQQNRVLGQQLAELNSIVAHQAGTGQQMQHQQMQQQQMLMLQNQILNNKLVQHEQMTQEQEQCVRSLWQQQQRMRGEFRNEEMRLQRESWKAIADKERQGWEDIQVMQRNLEPAWGLLSVFSIE